MEQLKEYLRIEKANGRTIDTIEIDVFIQGFNLSEEQVKECVNEIYSS